MWYEQPHGADIYISLDLASVRVLSRDVMRLRRRKHDTNMNERKNTVLCILEKESPTVSAFGTTNGYMRVYIWKRIQSRRSRKIDPKGKQYIPSTGTYYTELLDTHKVQRYSNMEQLKYLGSVFPCGVGKADDQGSQLTARNACSRHSMNNK